MRMSTSARREVEGAERLVRKHFEQVPFHNLFLLYGDNLNGRLSGGTCSDKTLSFIKDARALGFSAKLHSGFIGGRDIHRLASLAIKGRQYFADVGNGWPALKLYPADEEISYRSFGMEFRTQLGDGRLAIFHKNRGKESLQLEIDLVGKPEDEIHADILGRLSSGIVYPFSQKLRFAQIVGDRFLFLRDQTLYIDTENGYCTLEYGSQEEALGALPKYFGLDVFGMER